MLNLLDGEEFAFLGFEGGIANHAGGATHDGQRLVACQLEVLEKHDGDEVTDVEGVGCGVDTDIGGGDLFIELFFGAGHDVVDHAAPFEFFNEIGVHIIYNVFIN